ncbi:MAG: hypothetical protein IKL19_06305 [Paludibacteraceae bacterium]|nr:hypothetical protein [Paludibacteraceae bacterium]
MVGFLIHIRDILNGDKGTSGFPKASQRFPKGIPESVRRTYDAIAVNLRLTT